MIIDAHVHLYPPEISADPAAWAATAGEAQWAALCLRRRKDGRPVQSFPKVDELLRMMDASQITNAVLLGWYWEKPANCVAQNRFYAACVRAHADRLSAFATLHPAAGRIAVINELRRAREEGLVGLGELSPHSQGYAIDDAVFGEVITLAGEWGFPVNFHVTDPAARPYPGRVDTPLEDFGQLARAFPGTTFILAHGGGLTPVVAAGVVARACPNVYYDTAAFPLIYGEEVWVKIWERLGRERIIFGSDFPLNLYPAMAGGPEMARFLAEARRAGADARVLGENVRKLLNITATND